MDFATHVHLRHDFGHELQRLGGLLVWWRQVLALGASPPLAFGALFVGIAIRGESFFGLIVVAQRLLGFLNGGSWRGVFVFVVDFGGVYRLAHGAIPFRSSRS